MRLTTLLPHLSGLRLGPVVLAGDELVLVARSMAATARCLSCRCRSRQVHSQYTRRLADQPIGGRPVTIVMA